MNNTHSGSDVVGELSGEHDGSPGAVEPEGHVGETESLPVTRVVIATV